MSLPPASQGPKPQTREAAAVCLGLVLAVAVVFGQTAGFGFVNYDDNIYVYDNPVVKEGLTLHGFFWAMTYGGIGHWHPLTWLTHMADCQVYGTWVGGYHLTNVILHAAAAVFLFLALREMTGSLWRSACVAAIFAIHPLRAESVAWIAERKDVLSGMFCMLTLWLYARHVHQPSRGRYAGVVLAYGLGLLCKDMLVTLPFVLLLLDWWPLRRVKVSVGELIWEKIPMFVLVAGSCVATAMVPETVHDAFRLPLLQRLENGLVSCAIYPCQTVFPAHLFVPYLYPPDGQHPWWKIACAIFLLAAVSAIVVICRKNRPYLLVGWLWYLGMLVPTLGIVQISDYAAHADRYTYLPGIGLLLAGIWTAADLTSGWKHRASLAALAAAVMAILMACAWKQTSYWKTSEALWNHTLACDDDNYVAHNSLAYDLLDKGRLREAFSHFQKSLDLKPNNGDTHFSFGNILRVHGKIDEAIAQYEDTVRLTPSNGQAHNNLGSALRQKARLDEAIAQYEIALQLMPRNDAVHFNLAKVFYQQGRQDQAILQYEAVLELNPADVETQNNLAWLLATAPQAALRDGAKALQLALRANQLSGGKSPVILGTLAAALAETGQFSGAAETAQRAWQLAVAQGNTDLAAQLQAQKKYYDTGHPYHSP